MLTLSNKLNSLYSEDEVATALYDCSWDSQRAIEMLLEEGGDLGSWEETGKKKKKKAEKDEKDSKENEDWDNDNFEPSLRQDGDNRAVRGRGPPRFKRGGGLAPGGSRQDADQWKNKEFAENERNFESGRGRGGGRGLGPRTRGGMPPRTRGRGGGPRQFGGPGGPGPSVGGVTPPDSGPFGQIDTWAPVGEENSRRGKMSNRDAFDNAGKYFLYITYKESVREILCCSQRIPINLPAIGPILLRQLLFFLGQFMNIR